jgi:Ser/Thr protein kinase RdoA (MazF antagonist)
MEALGHSAAAYVAEADRAASDVAGRLKLIGPRTLLRASTNVVFRVGDAVLRVSPNEAGAARQVSLARSLSGHGVPVPRPLSDAVTVGRLQVTAWEYIDGSEQSIDYRQLGEAICRLHRILPSAVAGGDLPWCGTAAWLQLEENLEVAAGCGVVNSDDIAVLRQAVVELDGWQDLARDEPLVVCHGDVHPQNALMRGERLIILDWESICLGPRAWDHAALLTWPDRWGGNPDDYVDFSSGYGADLRQSPLARTLARVRLLAPTINMIINGKSSPIHAAEAQLRMRYWRGDPEAPAWTAQ